MIDSKMGQCFISACNKRKRKKIILLLVGLDNAGKTTTAKCLLRESRENIAPTVGFSIIKPHLTRHDVTLYDLGGGQRIRGIWKSYFSEAFGLIFVVDASDNARLGECKDVLHDLLKNPNIAGKPILLLANKQDCKEALDEIDICEALGVESTVNEFKCRTKIETCSATAYQGKLFDRAILKGYRWLVETIAADYEALSRRVELDVTQQKQIHEQDQKERVERIRKLREERDQTENSNRNLPSENEVKTNADDMQLVNPFRPIEEIQREWQEKSVDTKELSEKGPQTFPSSKNILSGSQSQEEMRPPLINGFMTGGSEMQQIGTSSVEAQRKKAKKKKRFSRNNKTAPLEIDDSNPNEESVILPPLQLRSGGQSIAKQGNLQLELFPHLPTGVKHSWGLSEELEPVEAESAVVSPR